MSLGAQDARLATQVLATEAFDVRQSLSKVALVRQSVVGWVGAALSELSDRMRARFAGHWEGLLFPAHKDVAPEIAPVVPAECWWRLKNGRTKLKMVRCSASTTRPMGSRTSASRSARSTGALCQRWVLPRVSVQTRLKQTQQSLRPLPQEQPRQLPHFPDQRAPRRWCAARLRSRAQDARAKRRCGYLGIRFGPVKYTCQCG